ncbi:hypothetical protein ACQKMD_12000 [Viridibacillus sp. NPDC096237]
MKASRFETYLVDQDFEVQRKEEKHEEICPENDLEQYPEGFFTEL